MNLLDDVPSIIWKSVKHLVVCEASYKCSSTFANREPTLERYCYTPLLTMWLSFPYFEIVASRTFFGKSSAPTSPPTAIASPPNPFISSTTSWAFFSSRLHKLTCQWGHITEGNGVNALADHNLRTLPGKYDSSTPPDSLRQTGASARAEGMFGRDVNGPDQHLGTPDHKLPDATHRVPKNSPVIIATSPKSKPRE